MVKLQNTDNTQVGGDAEQRELSSWLVGMQNGAATSEDSLVVSYKTKHTHRMTQQSFSLVFTKGIENACLTEALTRMFAAALFITAKTWKQPRCPLVGERSNKLWYIQTMEYYLVLKRNKLLNNDSSSMEEPYMYIAKWKKPIWKGYILYDSNYMTFWEGQHYGDSKKNQWFPGIIVEGRMNRQSMEDF